MMLNLIDQDFGENLVNRVCEQALTDRVRGPHDRQRLPLRAVSACRTPRSCRSSN